MSYIEQKKKDLIYCIFTLSQIHNERIIVDKDGNKTHLVSVALPKESAYFGYDITVEKQYVFSLNSNKYLCYVSFFKEQAVKLSKYNHKTKKYDYVYLKGKELKKEFDSYKINRV